MSTELSRRDALNLGFVLGALTLVGGAAMVPARVNAQTAAPALPYIPHAVKAPDGVMLNVQERGKRDGPAILFIHGGQQSQLSWARQVSDPLLLANFRLVTYDLRGHGMSDKPLGEAFYKNGKVWADDLAAVIKALGLTRPTVVNWSYGGRVFGDYLREYGASQIGAVNFVAAVMSGADRTRFGPGIAFLAPATSTDLATYVKGSIDFLRACFAQQPSAADFETMVAYNMMVPRNVRMDMVFRANDFDAVLAALKVPVMVTHGELDNVILPSMGRWIVSQVPNSTGSFYTGVGHSPFWEDAPRFNRELAELARRAS